MSDRVTIARETPAPVASVRAIAVGMLLLQVVWLLAVPPFRGTDEFDHAYRAAAVARGQWVAEPTSATRGTGAMLDVPADIVEAARPECEALDYTVAADCVGSRGDDGSVVASGAGRYQPVFYAVVGTLALPFEGTTALYVMRSVAALCCWGVMVLGLVALRRWARTAWPFVAFALVGSPMVIYSTVIMAPNGLELASALTLWACLTGLFRTAPSERDRHLLLVGSFVGSLLVTLRSLGPFWALLIVAAVLLAAPRRKERLVSLLKRRDAQLAAGWVAACALANVAWVLTQDSLVIGKLPEPPGLSRLEELREILLAMLTWVFQSVGAFPFQNDATHPAVYASYFLAVIWFTTRALRRSDPTTKAAILGVATLSLLIPAVITYQTLEAYGVSWQGRYTIPFSMGFLVLAGVSLEARAATVRRDAVVGVGVLYCMAHLVSPLVLVLAERDRSPGVADGAWILVPPAALTMLALLGAAAIWYGVARPLVTRATT